MLFLQAPLLWQEGANSMEKRDATWYYVIVYNYQKKGGSERTIILNPQYTKEEIAEVMCKESVDESFIHEMMEKGIFQDRDISIIAKDGGMKFSWHSYEDGRQGVYSIRKFAKRDKVTFHANSGTFSSKYHYTLLEKIEIFFEGVCEKVEKITKTWQKNKMVD